MSSNIIYTRLEYVYLIRHIPSGKFYVGSKFAKINCHPDLFWNKEHKHGYFTSSKIIKQMIVQDGIESFEVVYISERPNNDSREFEAAFLKIVDAAKSDNWINLSNSDGKFHRPKVCSVETRAKLSASHTGKHMSEESKIKLSLTTKGVPKGPKSKEHKLKISKANIGKKQSTEAVEKRSLKNCGQQRSNEFKTNLSKRMLGNEFSKGKFWINNGIKTMMVSSLDLIPDGFLIGRGVSPVKGKTISKMSTSAKEVDIRKSLIP